MDNNYFGGFEADMNDAMSDFYYDGGEFYDSCEGGYLYEEDYYGYEEDEYTYPMSHEKVWAGASDVLPF